MPKAPKTLIRPWCRYRQMTNGYQCRLHVIFSVIDEKLRTSASDGFSERQTTSSGLMDRTERRNAFDEYKDGEKSGARLMIGTPRSKRNGTADRIREKRAVKYRTGRIRECAPNMWGRRCRRLLSLFFMVALSNRADHIYLHPVSYGRPM